jgi:hypothetical protein
MEANEQIQLERDRVTQQQNALKEEINRNQ